MSHASALLLKREFLNLFAAIQRRVLAGAADPLGRIGGSRRCSLPADARTARPAPPARLRSLAVVGPGLSRVVLHAHQSRGRPVRAHVRRRRAFCLCGRPARSAFMSTGRRRCAQLTGLAFVGVGTRLSAAGGAERSPSAGCALRSASLARPTLFTIGVLLCSTTIVPRFLLFVPLAWSVVGGSAAIALGMHAGPVAAGGRRWCCSRCCSRIRIRRRIDHWYDARCRRRQADAG